MQIHATAHELDLRDDDGGIRDVANPYITRDALRLPPRLGTFQITDEGDLGVDRSSAAGLRKRITRRVLSAVGAFFHLPNYGAGVRVKGLIRVDEITRLQARILAQVRQEPDVRDARVVVARVAGHPNMLSVAVKAVPVFGDPSDVVVPIEVS